MNAIELVQGSIFYPFDASGDMVYPASELVAVARKVGAPMSCAI